MIYVKIPGLSDQSIATEARFERDETGRPVVVVSMAPSKASAWMLTRALPMKDFDLDLKVEVPGNAGTPHPYLRYKLDRCFIKSWSVSGSSSLPGRR